MAESLYTILMSMASNPATLRAATQKARPKIRSDYDKNVRKKMIQYYLDSYTPSKYKRIEPSPLFLAYQTNTKLIKDATAVEVCTTNTEVDIGDYYQSFSYYHQDGNEWNSVSAIHNITGKQYMLNIEDLRDEYGFDNGSVQGSWILDNFEKGIHPRTNGWPRKKYSRRMKYMPYISSISPLEAAEMYADKYFALDTSFQYILTELDKMWHKMF